MKPGSWASIFTIYGFGVLAVAALAKFIPLRIEFQQILHASAAQYAWLIALLGVPAALFAAPSGAIVDRVGPRVVLVGCGLLGALVDLAYYFAPSMHSFQLLRLVEGFANVGIFSAGPAMLMACTSGRRSIVAMTFWSTYTPVGFSFGLVLAGAFTGTAIWRDTFVIHGVLVLFVALNGLRLPTVRLSREGATASIRERLRGLAGAYRQGPVVHLALVFFVIMSLGFGANTIFPSYIARVHAISLAQTSALVAAATLMMMGGAFVVGVSLTRGVPPRILVLVLAVGACASGITLFWPGTALAVTAPLLCLWFVCMGGSNAVLLAVLPRVARPDQLGAAAGLLSQASAISTFITPPIWLAMFASERWAPFAAMVGGCWLISVVLLFAMPALRPPRSAAAH